MDPGAKLVSPVPDHWPDVEVTIDFDPHSLCTEQFWGPDAAQFMLLGGGHTTVTRRPLHIELTLPRTVSDECVVQPHLAGSAATISAWLGRPSFHGGAFVWGGGAWIVLGEKGAGKSTTMGMLANRGIPVLTDDLAVYDDGLVLSGPRCVDLRQAAAEHLQVGRDLGVVGTRERWRLDLGPCEVSAPLSGWVMLDWSDEIGVERIRPTDRLPTLAKHRSLQLPWFPAPTLLDLASHPAWHWSRSRTWADADKALDQLLARL